MLLWWHPCHFDIDCNPLPLCNVLSLCISVARSCRSQINNEIEQKNYNSNTNNNTRTTILLVTESGGSQANKFYSRICRLEKLLSNVVSMFCVEEMWGHHHRWFAGMPLTPSLFGLFVIVKCVCFCCHFYCRQRMTFLFTLGRDIWSLSFL